VNIVAADASKVRGPSVDRTNHRATTMVTRQAVTLTRSRNHCWQGSTAVVLYMSLSAILNM
jgi:hypothetical protein